MFWNNFDQESPPSNHAILLHIKDCGVFIAYTGESKQDGEDFYLDLQIEGAENVCLEGAEAHWILIPEI